MKLEAPVNFVMVEEPGGEFVTDSGLVLQNAPVEVMSASVIHCGLAFDFSNTCDPLFSVGDLIFFPKKAGLMLTYQDKKYRILPCDMVMAVERK